MTAGEDVSLVKGQKITVTVDPKFANSVDDTLIYADYKNMPAMVRKGGLIYIDDGLIYLKVLSKAEDLMSLECEVPPYPYPYPYPYS